MGGSVEGVNGARTTVDGLVWWAYMGATIYFRAFTHREVDQEQRRGFRKIGSLNLTDKRWVSRNQVDTVAGVPPYHPG